MACGEWFAVGQVVVDCFWAVCWLCWRAALIVFKGDFVMGERTRKVVYLYREVLLSHGVAEVPADVPEAEIEQWLNDNMEDVVGDAPDMEVVDADLELDAVIDGWRLRYALAGPEECRQLMLVLERHEALTDGGGQWRYESERHVVGREPETEAWLLHDEGLEGDQAEVVGFENIQAAGREALR
jgi:hypothetical protein